MWSIFIWHVWYGKYYVQGYALIEYESFEEAEKAIAAMDGGELLTQTVNVDWAFSKGPFRRRNNRRRYVHILVVFCRLQICFGAKYWKTLVLSPFYWFSHLTTPLYYCWHFKITNFQFTRIDIREKYRKAEHIWVSHWTIAIIIINQWLNR